MGSEAIYVYSTAIGGDVDFAVGNDGQIEFVVQEEYVPLIAVPEKAEEVVAVAVGLELRGIVSAQNTLHDSGIGVAI